jgi:hypothetical protein
MRDTSKILMQNPSAAARIFTVGATPMVRHNPGIPASGVSVSWLKSPRHRRT